MTLKWADATDAQRVDLLYRTLTCVRACVISGRGRFNEIDDLVSTMLDEVEGAGYQGISLPGDIGPDGEVEP